jgi:hypothetical protein
MLHRKVKLEKQEFRKEVSMEPPQYNEDLLGLQKREYLAKMFSFKKASV